ncbi:MAG: HIT domain-containing protein [Calditrichia bacterium]|nr:HIT domain-containing protein [Calditrichia bacterium]MCK5454593.1 HIT domain-containing protein [Calditrichia bacterium]NOQ96709.1 HIT domain-containing protein [Calditrichia bacterium]
MENLWAPWRMEYISKEKEGNSEPCIFCHCIKQKTDRKNLILYRGQEAFIIMNRYPYNNGHVMVVPYRHTGAITDLQSHENDELFQIIRLTIYALDEVMKPHGYNIGMNLGRVAGAGIEDHLHYHVVPRWNGDTNFMPVLTDTKVISEALDKSYHKLAKSIKKITGKVK